jgi:hypothetical protein
VARDVRWNTVIAIQCQGEFGRFGCKKAGAMHTTKNQSAEHIFAARLKGQWLRQLQSREPR